MLKDDPAFPLNSGDGGINLGLSNRDLAAMFAMQGILASNPTGDLGLFARRAYDAADALIKASERAGNAAKVSIRPRTKARFVGLDNDD